MEESDGRALILWNLEPPVHMTIGAFQDMNIDETTEDVS